MMWRQTSPGHDRAGPEPESGRDGPATGPGFEPVLSDCEVHFLYWFIQGSIMNPETRSRLRRAWGLCERHALAHLAVEFAFRNGWVHGCALLYEDLMGRARQAFERRVPVGLWLALGLRQTAPCLMCELGFGPHSPTTAPVEVLARGRQTVGLQAFARSTEPCWRPAVCVRCAGRAVTAQSPRCRPHLLRDLLTRQPVDLGTQRELVVSIHGAVGRYSRSFRLEFQGTDTVEDRAGLVAAIGWCSGWSAWLRLVMGSKV